MKKTFPASLEVLYEILEFIRTESFSAGFNEPVVTKIELALEEVIVNITSYGYPNGKGTLEIESEITNPHGLKFIVRDSGVPYDPTSQVKDFDPKGPLEGRLIGGYGIYLILKIMDDVQYQRVNGCNILTLIKYQKSIQKIEI